MTPDASALHRLRCNPELRARFPRDASYVAPTSYAQRRMWVLDRLQPATAVYNLAYVLRLAGPLDRPALEAALTHLVARHAPLRTRIAVEGGEPEPQQIIDPPSPMVLAVERLASGSGYTAQTAAEAAVRAEVQRPFDLAQGPLLRARLLQLHEQEHWLLLAMHHAIFDGWSAALVWRELAALYAACRQGDRSPLTLLPMQYADYAAWQRERSTDNDVVQQIAYWRDALHGLSLLVLPTDHARPALPSGRGRRLGFALDPALIHALRDLARCEGATLFMVLLASFQVLLHRYTGEDDIAVGVPVAGRTRPELEALVGLFVNTIVVRGDLAGQPSFRAYLARVKARARAAYAHQEVPFERLVEALAPKRDPSRNPFFDVLVNYQRHSTSWSKLGFDALEVAVEERETATAKFDLNLRLREDPDGLQGSLEYAVDLFEPSTIARMVGHWRILLEAIAADPDRAIGRLPLLDAAERRAILERGRGPVRALPPTTLVDLFARTAMRVPQAVAAVCGSETLTYDALNARANRLAHRLKQCGVDHETPVVVALERSLDLAVALLGVLKAGGAYVPLDPRHPSRRLAWLIANVAPPVLIARGEVAPDLTSFAITVDLGRDHLALDALPASPPAVLVAPHHLAYILYTSGSTGEAKGVMIEHRSVVAHLAAVQEVLGGRAERVLQSAPIGFDQSVWQMLFPWQAGGTVVFPLRGADSSVEDLVRDIRRHDVTLLRTVPSLLGALTSGPGLHGCTSLRSIVSAGEALPPKLADSLRGQCAAALFNAYGPTETTFVTTIERCLRSDHEGSNPLGAPLANTVIHITDDAGEVVPEHVVGEIRIGGAGLARGYWRIPEMTHRAFVSGESLGEDRMYRTGDYARRLPDGRIRFLGRRDRQVKVRGVRVELGEIEAAILMHPAVAACAVQYERDEQDRERITACIQPLRAARVTTEELHAYLRERLPRASLPTGYAQFDALPLTANGKIDRQRVTAAIAATTASAPDMRQTVGLHPRITALWVDVLGGVAPRDGDDFFVVGGHSLAAMRLLSRVHDEFGVELSLRGFFAQPTVSGIATVLAARGITDDRPTARAPSASRPGNCSPSSGAESKEGSPDSHSNGSS